MPISEVYNCDCLEFMRSLPDKHFDLCIADPPYGINAGKMTMGSGNHKFVKGKDWDRRIPSDELFEEIFRVSENQIIWGGNYFKLPLCKDWIIWDKLNPNLSFAEAELAWCSINRNIRIFKYLTTKLDKGGKIHPTQKPIALYSWLLDNYTSGGGKIFDPFLGSGSSRIAAYKKGFDFYACELDKDFYNAQEERFRSECLGESRQKDGTILTQQKLF